MALISTLFRGILCLGGISSLLASPLPDVESRYHEQWHVSDKERAALQENLGVVEVSYTSDEGMTPKGLAPRHMQRWTRFYNQCLRDGCTFCDHYEGSCEQGTCGSHNSLCRLKVNRKGVPTCGRDCAYYALKRVSGS